MVVREKHSSLLILSINDGEKSFMTLTPGGFGHAGGSQRANLLHLPTGKKFL
jgi:hypothetical protein